MQLQEKRRKLESELETAQERGYLDEVASLRLRLDGLLSDSDIDFAYTKERPEKKLYQHYLARMRDTGQTNLNLDVVDLQAFRWQYIMAAGPGGPQSREDREFSQLYRNFMLYPQELVPILDQQLKDSALEWACEEENLGFDGMERVENEQRAREMHQSVFKVRPYAGETRVNMRDLNPQGESQPSQNFFVAETEKLTRSLPYRHRQDRLHQRSRYSCDSHHPRYETRYASLVRLRPLDE